MAVSSTSTAQQQVLGRRVRETIAHEMVLQSDNNLDPLQGLLTANYYSHSKPFLSAFTQLAIASVFDLGLNKPVPKETPVTINCHRFPQPLEPRTMEERRAVLGCFLVTSIISCFLRRIDVLHWTPHLDDCLKVLDDEKECLNDDILVQQVRLQRIAEAATRSTSHHGVIGTTENAEIIPEFLSQLEVVVKCRLFTASPKNAVVFLHLYSIELEVVLSAMYFSSYLSIAPQQGLLQKGLELILSWFEIFLLISPVGYVGLPLATFSQLARCLTAFYRLATLDDSTWDMVWDIRLGGNDILHATPCQASGYPVSDALGEETADYDWFMDLLSFTH
ncbi:hypothetical protein BBP40_005799 [Aspergillus hancockii]|nr:hypothetical protein BBP40_005799 [Aspergillus hancockii]